ncbi:MAG: hypothetical protein WKG00_03210 [Polyangiaceae bacterium]
MTLPATCESCGATGVALFACAASPRGWPLVRCLGCAWRLLPLAEVVLVESGPTVPREV